MNFDTKCLEQQSKFYPPLYIKSITSFTLSRLIIHHMKRRSPMCFAPTVIKYNSRVYFIISLILFLAIASCLRHDITKPSYQSPICSPPTFPHDGTLRCLFRLSKFHEYVDIFNVLAADGVVNKHFAGGRMWWGWCCFWVMWCCFLGVQGRGGRKQSRG